MKPYRVLILALALAGCARPAAEPVPAPVAPPRPVAPQLVTHPTADHTCVLDGRGELTCWDRSDRGQLGVGDTALRLNRVVADAAFVMAAVGARHTCALADDDVAWCWGANDAGQLGTGDSADVATPRPIASERRFARIVAGSEHTCALDAEGRAFCWGDNRWGQLGSGTSTPSVIPVAVAGESTFLRLSAGSRHTCGVTTDARALCWGDNFLGQLGMPRGTTGSLVPVTVPGVDSVVAVSAGHGHTCALAPTGAGRCWGQNGIGQLGTGAPPGAGTAALVAAPNALTGIRTGYHHTCAVDVDGAGWCWGANTASEPGAASVTGQLGSDVSWTNLPARVPVEQPLVSIAPGDGHTCALTRAGVVHCFGSNRFGQLGQSEPARSFAPVRVLRAEADPSISQP